MSTLQRSTSPDGRVWTLVFDHGKANEMGSAQLAELEALTQALRTDPQVVALITVSRRCTSKGQPIFVAGANVTERVGWTDAQVKAHVRWQREVLRGLANAPVFHVVVVNGLALGWGTEYLLTADYRIAAEAASFALPETGLGILPGAGGTSALWQLVGPGHALRLGATGERISAGEAARIGLVEEVVADVDAGVARAEALAGMVARRSPTAVAAFKAGVRAAMGDAAAVEADAYDWCVETGEAAVGRAHFQQIVAGGTVPWGPKQLR
jgi:enoyl-CoA hydratase/carnithine racemase